MSYRIPAYMPIDSILIEDIRMKRLLKDMPNCSGIGIVFGLFFHLLKNEKQQCRYDDIDIIADELRTSVPMVVTVIENYGFFSIFEDDLGKKFFSPALDKALVPYFEKCEKNSVSAKIGAEKRKMKLENQKEELRQLSLIDSSQRPLSECSANRIEKNIKEENKNKNKKIKENLSLREEKEERENFSNFKNQIQGKEVRFTLPYPFANFAQNTVIRLRKTGYLYNETICKDLSSQQAHTVWEYMFENQEKIRKRIWEQENE
jgi:hypothetical protein